VLRRALQEPGVDVAVADAFERPRRIGGDVDGESLGNFAVIAPVWHRQLDWELRHDVGRFHSVDGRIVDEVCGGRVGGLGDRDLGDRLPG
jgi:hypothetical protein